MWQQDPSISSVDIIQEIVTVVESGPHLLSVSACSAGVYGVLRAMAHVLAGTSGLGAKPRGSRKRVSGCARVMTIAIVDQQAYMRCILCAGNFSGFFFSSCGRSGMWARRKEVGDVDIVREFPLRYQETEMII